MNVDRRNASDGQKNFDDVAADHVHPKIDRTAHVSDLRGKKDGAVFPSGFIIRNAAKVDGGFGFLDARGNGEQSRRGKTVLLGMVYKTVRLPR